MAYTIKKGDTLSSIAARNNTSVQALAKANGIANVNQISAGRAISIPKISAPVYRPSTPNIAAPVIRSSTPSPVNNGSIVRSSTPVQRSMSLTPTPKPAPKVPMMSNVQNAVTQTAQNVSNTTNKVTTATDKMISSVLKTVPQNLRAAAAQNVPLIAKALKNEGILTQKTLAYALATVQHESGFTPKDEIRANASAQPGLARLQNNYQGGWNYHGRGFIQLTHAGNYAQMGQRIGMGDQLVNNPELANRPDVAAKILAAFFKDRGVAQAADRGDFVGARRPVNGTDKAYSIAQSANRFLAAVPDHPDTFLDQQAQQNTPDNAIASNINPAMIGQTPINPNISFNKGNFFDNPQNQQVTPESAYQNLGITRMPKADINTGNDFM